MVLGCDDGSITHEHEWGGWTIITPATCMETGMETRICLLDASHSENRSTQINLSAHNFKIIDDQVTIAPTCTTTGIGKIVCTHNELHTLEGDVIPALGHAGINAIAVTCTTAGNTGSGNCTRQGCGQTVTGTVIDALGHAGINPIAATCTTAGNTGSGNCTRQSCGQTVTGTVIDALGHVMEWIITSQSSYTLSGIETNSCQRESCTYIDGTRYFGNPLLITNRSQYSSALSEIRNGGNNKSYILTINGDIKGISTDTDNRGYFGSTTNISVTLKGTGTLNTYDENGSMFRLSEGQTLIIDSDDLILYGRTNGQNGHRGHNDTSVIFVGTGATFELKKGKITGNTSRTDYGYGVDHGGGVYVDSGTFTMSGGVISGNTVGANSISPNATSGYYYGGGVYVDGGTFTMTGGEIKENISIGGGGVYVKNGSFIMDGGKISGNRERGNGGGGVSINNLLQATFIMNGGEISGNTAVYRGGGVNGRGIFTMNGGKISQNSITSTDTYTLDGGGGVYGGITMNGGEISWNTSLNGGGVSGKMTMTGGKVNGNTNYGVYGEIIMSGGEISGNTSGGVYGDGRYRGTNIMTGGEISRNAGVGVYAHSIIFIMSGGEINMNDDNGISIDADGNTILIIDGGKISGNKRRGVSFFYNSIFPTYTSSLYIINGIIYGNDVDEPFKNNTGSLSFNSGMIQYGGIVGYGSFSGDNYGIKENGYFNRDSWISNGNLANTQNSINVVNGELVPLQ
jgi:hypothetical protein